jgi:hypothetical protein
MWTSWARYLQPWARPMSRIGQVRALNPAATVPVALGLCPASFVPSLFILAVLLQPMQFVLTCTRLLAVPSSYQTSWWWSCSHGLACLCMLYTQVLSRYQAMSRSSPSTTLPPCGSSSPEPVMMPWTCWPAWWLLTPANGHQVRLNMGGGNKWMLPPLGGTCGGICLPLVPNNELSGCNVSGLVGDRVCVVQSQVSFWLPGAGGGGTPTGGPHTAQSGKPDCRVRLDQIH